MTESIRAQSPAVRAIGPWTLKLVIPTRRLFEGTSPVVGRIALTPENVAGLRRLPPLSDPVQSGSMPQASATPDPPDEPPQAREGSNAFPV